MFYQSHFRGWLSAARMSIQSEICNFIIFKLMNWLDVWLMLPYKFPRTHEYISLKFVLFLLSSNPSKKSVAIEIILEIEFSPLELQLLFETFPLENS